MGKDESERVHVTLFKPWTNDALQTLAVGIECLRLAQQLHNAYVMHKQECFRTTFAALLAKGLECILWVQDVVEREMEKTHGVKTTSKSSVGH